MLRGDIALESEKTGMPFDDVKTLREGEQALGRWADPVRDRRGDLLSCLPTRHRSSRVPICWSTADGLRDDG